jgi:hypothetical protein
MDAPPLFEACRLWKKTSASGHTYLVGRMAGVRVLVMANRKRDGEDAPTHVLLFGSADNQPRPTHAAQPPARPAHGHASHQARMTLPARPRPDGHGGKVRIPDDPLPI